MVKTTNPPEIPADLIGRIELRCHTCDAGCPDGCREDDVERVLHEAWPALYDLAQARARALADEWWGRATEATSEPLSWRRVCHDLRVALAVPTP